MGFTAHIATACQYAGDAGTNAVDKPFDVDVHQLVEFVSRLLLEPLGHERARIVKEQVHTAPLLGDFGHDIFEGDGIAHIEHARRTRAPVASAVRPVNSRTRGRLLAELASRLSSPCVQSYDWRWAYHHSAAVRRRTDGNTCGRPRSGRPHRRAARRGCTFDDPIPPCPDRADGRYL